MPGWPLLLAGWAHRRRQLQRRTAADSACLQRPALWVGWPQGMLCCSVCMAVLQMCGACWTQQGWAPCRHLALHAARLCEVKTQQAAGRRGLISSDGATGMPSVVCISLQAHPAKAQRARGSPARLCQSSSRWPWRSGCRASRGSCEFAPCASRWRTACRAAVCACAPPAAAAAAVCRVAHFAAR